jgi:hypothetical protein
VPAITIAAMTSCALAVREACPQLPLGINVLRNDAAAALAIAVAVGASCVRVNVLSGARVTDQGVIEGRAAELLRLRRTLAGEGWRSGPTWRSSTRPRWRHARSARRPATSCSGRWPTRCW